MQPTLPISSLIHSTNNTDNVNPDTGPAAHAKALVKTALDNLEVTGALQCLNWIDIAELLNPAEESHEISNITNKGIFDAVMDAKEFERDARGGNDDNDDDVDVSKSAPVAPSPTHCELLQAALMLRKHVATLNDPFAHKFEVMLESFEQQMHAVKM